MEHFEEELWEEELSDEDRNPKHKKASWSQIVGEQSTDNENLKIAQGSKAATPRDSHHRLTPNKLSSERLYTKEEVIAILKESKLKGSQEGEPEWTMVKSRASIKKATSEARELLGVSKKKRKMQCWERKGTDHISTECPLGISCHYCHRKGHRIADCPRNQPRVRGDRGKRVLEEDMVVEEIKQNTIFLPISEDMKAAKKRIQKLAGVLSKSSGNPSVEDMVEGVRATSSRLAKFQWRPFRSG